MAKREKKSIVDLMSQGASSPEEEQLEKAVEKIHQIPTPKKVKKEKTIRVTVDTPESLHKQLKKIVVDEGTDLRAFYLQAVKEKCERLGYKTSE